MSTVLRSETTKDSALLHWRTEHWRFATAVLLVLLAVEIWLLAVVVIPANSAEWQIGIDYVYYRDLGIRWLTTGQFYHDRQLAGPYAVQLLDASGYGDVLYPPSALLLFVPSAVAPAILWWVIPIGITSYSLYRHRPAAWSWPVMIALLMWPRAIGSYLFGNTDIWVVAAVAAGTVWGWPALAVTLKPTLVPLAFIGVRSVWWWIIAAIGLVFVAATAPMWVDYMMAMRNVRGIDIGYSLGSLPLAAIPLVAWVARSQLNDGNVKALFQMRRKS